MTADLKKRTVNTNKHRKEVFLGPYNKETLCQLADMKQHLYLIKILVTSFESEFVIFPGKTK